MADDERKSPKKSSLKAKREDADETSNFKESKVTFNVGQFHSKGMEEHQKHVASRRKFKLQIIFYLIYIILNTIFVYVIKPLTTFLQLIFLTTIIWVHADENKNTLGGSTKDSIIGGGLVAFGYVLIFLIPLYHFFTIGFAIVAIHDRLFSKIFATITIFIETITAIPLTFFYSNNLYSVFLFEERGFEQLLAPWLVFFPTVYCKSIFEIVRNFIDPLYFFGIGIIKYNELKINQFQAYLVILIQLMLCLCIFKIVGNGFITALRIKESLSKKWPERNRK
jgi:hypothetical protein